MHQDLRETLDLIIEDSGMHHTKIVRNVVSGLLEILQQDQALTENPKIISEPVYHVANAVQITQQQLVTQLSRCK